MNVEQVDGFVSIAVASRSLDVSADTIRRWTKLGLIKAIRDKNNNRLFNLAEIERLQKKLAGGDDETRFEILKSRKLFTEVSCVDLFAGGGGTALGFHNAGIPHVMLNEIDSDAVATLQHNSETHNLGWNVLSGDVRNINFSEYSGVSVIQAGFPCQAFSYAGKSRGFEDARGTLFFEFARAIKAIQPKIAIGENVRGLVRSCP